MFTLKFYKNSFKGLNSRVSGAAIRFLIPLYIITFSSESELGIYYIAISALLSAATFLGFELGYYHSAEYLNKRAKTKKNVFSNFILQGIQGTFFITIISMPFILGGIFFSKFQLYSIFIPILFATEALSFELGRFFWNIREIKHASFRDLIRSVALAIAFIGSLYLYDMILSFFSIIVLILVNFILIIYEVLRWGDKNYILKNIFIFGSSPLEDVYNFLKKLLKTSGPQFLQNQIISLSILLEKLVITLLIGVAFQGVYSFIYSIIQISAYQVLSPHLARTKRIIISSQPYFLKKTTYESALKLYPITLFFITLSGCVSYFILPFLFEVLNKNPIQSLFSIILVVIVSSSTNTYTSTVAPLYGQKRRWIKANLISIFIFIPFILGSFVYKYFYLDQILIVLGFIFLFSIAQTVIRLVYFKSMTLPSK